jgi:hypothetical protein
MHATLTILLSTGLGSGVWGFVFLTNKHKLMFAWLPASNKTNRREARWHCVQICGSVALGTSACHAADPASISGRGGILE